MPSWTDEQVAELKAALTELSVTVTTVTTADLEFIQERYFPDRSISALRSKVRSLRLTDPDEIMGNSSVKKRKLILEEEDAPASTKKKSRRSTAPSATKRATTTTASTPAKKQSQKQKPIQYTPASNKSPVPIPLSAGNKLQAPSSALRRSTRKRIPVIQTAEALAVSGHLVNHTVPESEEPSPYESSSSTEIKQTRSYRPVVRVGLAALGLLLLKLAVQSPYAPILVNQVSEVASVVQQKATPVLNDLQELFQVNTVMEKLKKVKQPETVPPKQAQKEQPAKAKQTSNAKGSSNADKPKPKPKTKSAPKKKKQQSSSPPKVKQQQDPVQKKSEPAKKPPVVKKDPETTQNVPPANDEPKQRTNDDVKQEATPSKEEKTCDGDGKEGECQFKSNNDEKKVPKFVK